MRTTDLESKCPACSHEHTAVTSLDGDHVPKPGDVTFCIMCASMLVFEDNLSLRIGREEDRKKIDPDTLKQTEMALAELLAMRKRRNQ